MKLGLKAYNLKMEKAYNLKMDALLLTMCKRVSEEGGS